MIKVGAKADFNFTIKTIQNGEEKEVEFSTLLGRKTIVSVYMKNNTPGCNKQTLSLAENAAWFNENGFNIVAISKDTCGSHKKYADKQGINYVLVSDPEFKFANATDTMVPKKMFGRNYVGPSRSAFVIDEDGTILGTIEKIDTKAHAEELKALVESL